ncbi:MAG: hypothetical protein KDA58_01000 [Planctomycetaceae bacterium]|nr:hypothetical protein [Planctomycetaceae bacterium]
MPPIIIFFFNDSAATEIAWETTDLSDEEFRHHSILVALAGPVAEMIHTGDPFHPALVAEWSQDWRLAWQAAAAKFPDHRRRLNHLEQTSLRLYRRLSQDDHWSAIATLVDHLLAHETLDEDEIAEVLGNWLDLWD